MPASPPPVTTSPGTYALLCEAHSALDVQIGRLGLLHVRSGFYLYCGSAFSRGGIGARLAHHRGIAAHPHWHIDYLRQGVCLRQVWYSADTQHREHQWAAICRKLPGATVPLARFGASDCRCVTHLLYFAACPAFDAFCHNVFAMEARHAAVDRLVL